MLKYGAKHSLRYPRSGTKPQLYCSIKRSKKNYRTVTLLSVLITFGEAYVQKKGQIRLKKKKTYHCKSFPHHFDSRSHRHIFDDSATCCIQEKDVVFVKTFNYYPCHCKSNIRGTHFLSRRLPNPWRTVIVSTSWCVLPQDILLGSR